jgi:hypothetical protein
LFFLKIPISNCSVFLKYSTKRMKTKEGDNSGRERIFNFNNLLKKFPPFQKFFFFLTIKQFLKTLKNFQIRKFYFNIFGQLDHMIRHNFQQFRKTSSAQFFFSSFNTAPTFKTVKEETKITLCKFPPSIYLTELIFIGDFDIDDGKLQIFTSLFDRSIMNDVKFTFLTFF